LKAAFSWTGAPGTPLKLPASSGIGAPLLCARSPTTGFETSWQVPQKSTERWNCDCAN
jgi:hypothetical protein